jgi:ribosomal protein S8
MTTYRRHGNRWTINEILSLQREYELLEWTIQEIAVKHDRSVRAILCKLEAEGFIDSWVNARGFDDSEFKNEIQLQTVDLVGAVEEVDDSVSEVDRLNERIWNLETNVNEISSIVKQMFETMVVKSSKNNSKRTPLRRCL